MSLLDTLNSLQATLRDLAQYKSRLENIPTWMVELHAEHSQRRSEIAAEEAAHRESERQRREAEAAHADAQEKLKHFQQQIGQVTNQREYGALLKEIDTVKTKIKEAEDKAMKAIGDVESSAAKLAEVRAAFADLDSRYQAELARWEGEKPQLAERAAELEATATELKTQVPRAQLTLFERILQRNAGEAMAPVKRLVTIRSSNSMWHCGGCNFNVRPQIIVEIQAGTLHQCDSCKRILFWEPEPVEEA